MYGLSLQAMQLKFKTQKLSHKYNKKKYINVQLIKLILLTLDQS